MNGEGFDRKQVEAWLISQGFDEARIRGARQDTLHKAYRSPEYLRQLKQRGDYFPAARKDKDNGSIRRLHPDLSAGPVATLAPPAMQQVLEPHPPGELDHGTVEPCLTRAEIIELIRVVVAEMLKPEEW